MNEINQQNFDLENSDNKRYYSLNSDSINDDNEEKNSNIVKKQSEELSKKSSLSSLNISNIDIPPINIPLNDCKKTDDLKGKNHLNRTDIIIKRYSSSNENKRYENMNEIYNDNFKFFSFFKDDYNEDDEDIVNNEISSVFNIEENEDNNKHHNDTELNNFDSYELKTENINIYDNSSILSKSADKEKNITNDYAKKNDKEYIINLDNNVNKNIEKNNEEIISNDKITEEKKPNIIDTKIKNKELIDLDNMNKQRTIQFMNMTKQKKIFHKFLSVGADTSYLYSLEDDMKILILNPKIIFNYPYNKKERELE